MSDGWNATYGLLGPYLSLAGRSDGRCSMTVSEVALQGETERVDYYFTVSSFWPFHTIFFSWWLNLSGSQRLLMNRDSKENGIFLSFTLYNLSFSLYDKCRRKKKKKAIVSVHMFMNGNEDVHLLRILALLRLFRKVYLNMSRLDKKKIPRKSNSPSVIIIISWILCNPVDPV